MECNFDYIKPILCVKPNKSSIKPSGDVKKNKKTGGCWHLENEYTKSLWLHIILE